MLTATQEVSARTKEPHTCIQCGITDWTVSEQCWECLEYYCWKHECPCPIHPDDLEEYNAMLAQLADLEALDATTLVAEQAAV